MSASSLADDRCRFRAGNQPALAIAKVTFAGLEEWSLPNGGPSAEISGDLIGDRLVPIDTAIRAALPVCSILLGFLFAGFWWTLNRELTFKVEDRHFKLGIGLLLVAMLMLAVFGVVLPLRAIAYANPAFLLDYRGVVLALVTVFGYMLTDMGHYGVFKLPKYRTASEKALFVATLLTVLGLIVKWHFF